MDAVDNYHRLTGEVIGDGGRRRLAIADARCALRRVLRMAADAVAELDDDTFELVVGMQSDAIDYRAIERMHLLWSPTAHTAEELSAYLNDETVGLGASELNRALQEAAGGADDA
jgi:hypothetical protein